MAEAWSKRMTDSTMARFPLLAEEWTYQWGLVLKGVEGVWRATGDQRYFAYIRTNIDAFVRPDGVIRGYHTDEHNVDRLNTGKALFALYEQTGDSRYKHALDHLRSQLDTQPRTRSGGFWHKQIYPNQMWLDGIYMADAFWAQYESRIPTIPSGCAWDDIVHQVTLIEQHTRDPKTGLLYHAWDESKEQRWANPDTGCSPHFWGRAMGWYGMALVDILDFLPSAHRQRADLIAILQRMVAALVCVQDQRTGLWYQVLDQGARAGNYLESSASCMFVYALIKGARGGLLPGSCLEVARKAYDGIIRRFVTVDSAGQVHLSGTCRSAGLGGAPYRDGSYQYYISEPIVSDNHHGVGAFIMASVEMEGLHV
jgi:unsaturated rhamnogalacturonyl hydrolase